MRAAGSFLFPLQNLRGFLLALTVMLPYVGFSQTDTQVTLQGTVVDADSLEKLPYVHIREQTGRLGTATDAQGYFHVNVRKQDTIMFTIVGYEPYFLVPADSTEVSLRKLTISMTPKVNELREITVKAYDDISKFIRPDEVPFSMERQRGEPLFERKEAKESPAVGVAGGMNGARLEGAVTAFANLFNNKYQQEKKLKKILEIKEVEEQHRYIEQIMTEKYQEMLAFATDLSEADIQRFTQIYMPNPRSMMNMDDYAIMLSIVEGMKTFETESDRLLAVEKLLKTKVFEGEETTKRQ